MLSPNTVLQNRYRVIRQLGKGGMGTVYEAVDQRLSSIVAIKETIVTTDEARQAFEREASLLANLRHRSLPIVTDHFAEGGAQYLVMQYIPGDDLAQLLELRQRPFPTQEALRWADQVLHALEYLHSHNPPILHRDIKPANLKLTREGELFLIDFGLSKGTAGQMPTLMTSRSVKGYTPAYAPLEQIHGAGTDPRSDLYSVGATLYHLITNLAPTDSPTRFNATDEEQSDPLLPADQVNPEVPHSVAAILASAMAMNRRHRPTSAAEMRRQLREAAGSPAMRDIGILGDRESIGMAPTLPAVVVDRDPPGNPLPPTTPSGPPTEQLPPPTITSPPPQVPNRRATTAVTNPEVVPSGRRTSLSAIVLLIVVILAFAIGSTMLAPGLFKWIKGGTAGNGATSNANVTAAASPGHPESTPSVSPTPTPTPTPEFVNVRLRLISQGASRCSVYSGMKVTLATRNRTFSAVTNGSGVATFGNVPCGDAARITAPGIQLVLRSGAVFSISHSLQCSGSDIYLGSYGDLKGSLISEREANVCYK
jgi:serine/threonine protein kinase